jgi:hypothetical protein
MKIDLSFAELHNALFLGQANLQLKLDPKRRSGLVLQYDRDEKELLVYFGGELAIVPASNISSLTPKDPTVLGPVPGVIRAPILTPTRIVSDLKESRAIDQKDSVLATQDTISRVGKLKQASAQIATPASHVHSDAPGKVRD